MADENINILVTGRDAASGPLSNIRRTLSGLQQDVKGGILSGIGLGAGISAFNLVQGAVHKVTDEIGSAIHAAEAAQVSTGKLTTALHDNDAGWRGNVDAIEKVITAREELGFTGNEQRTSLAVLVAVTKDHTAALAIERTAMDLSRLTGKDLATTSLILGKAYEGNTTALKKMGIEIPKGTKGMEALAIVQARVAGQADAFAKTTAGQSAALNAEMEGLQEEIGAQLLPILNTLMGFVAHDLVPGFRTALTVIGQVTDVLAHLGPVTVVLKDALEALGIIVGAKLAIGLLNGAKAFFTFGAAASSSLAAATAATTANSAATDANTVASEGNTAAGESNIAVTDAGTAATDANTAATAANVAVTDADSAAKRRFGLSTAAAAAGALAAIPILYDLTNVLGGAVLQFQYGGKYGADYSKVVQTVGGDADRLTTILHGLDDTAKAQGRSLKDDVIPEFLAIVSAGDDVDTALDKVKNHFNIASAAHVASLSTMAAWREGVVQETPLVIGAFRAMTSALLLEQGGYDAKAVAAAHQLPRDLANAIKQGRADVASAWTTFLEDQKTAQTTAQKEAYYRSILTSKALAKGLKDGRPEVRAEAMGIKADAMYQLQLLTSGATQVAVNTGTNLAAGLLQQQVKAAHAAQELRAQVRDNLTIPGAYAGGYAIGGAWINGIATAIAQKMYLVMQQTTSLRNVFGHSLPTEGPLQHPEIGGKSIGKAWLGGILEGIGGFSMPNVLTGGSPSLALAGGGSLPSRGGATITINVNAPLGTPAAGQALAREVTPELVRELRRQRVLN